jgi:hypothetical protein
MSRTADEHADALVRRCRHSIEVDSILPSANRVMSRRRQTFVNEEHQSDRHAGRVGEVS